MRKGNTIYRALKKETAGVVVRDAPLAPLTTFHLGGAADLLVVPRTVDDVLIAVAACRERELPLYVMGAGSNLIVPDEGVRGVVLRLPSRTPACGAEGEPRLSSVPWQRRAAGQGLCGMTLGDGVIVAQGGATDPELAEFALAHSVPGYEWIYDLPGSVGGAVFMNAGNSDGEMQERLVSVRWVTPEGELRRAEPKELEFGYRTSLFHREPAIIVEAVLKADVRGSEGRIYAKMQRIKAVRRSKFPARLLCAGSIFKRPPGHYAGKLIEDAGLGGLRVGDAMVAHEHKGFIINAGNATAADVTGLIELVRARVLEDSGITLETEVELFSQRRFV